MDNETARYIIKYFSRYLTNQELLAIHHIRTTYKLGDSRKNNPEVTRILKEKGWLTSDQTVLDLLKDGYEKFELNVANRILNQHRDSVFLNFCPQCNKLARTPRAKQCRYCGYDWH